MENYVLVLLILSVKVKGLTYEEIKDLIEKDLGHDSPWGNVSIFLKTELTAIKEGGLVSLEGSHYKITNAGRKILENHNLFKFYKKYLCS